MLNFADPANALVISGQENETLKTTATDGMIVSVLIGDKETMDTAYIFPESKKSAGYKRLTLTPWTAKDVSYGIREKESCGILRRFFTNHE